MNESFIDDYVVIHWNVSEPEKAVVEFLQVDAAKTFKPVHKKGYEKTRRFFLDEDYDYLAIALGNWATEMCCEDEMVAESFILNEEIVGFIIDIAAKKTKLITKLKWEERDKAETVKEAINYISDYLALFGGSDLEEVAKYAKEWNIPFSIKLMKSIAKKKELIDYAGWNSSYC